MLYDRFRHAARSFLAVFALAAALFPLVGCTTNPATGRTQFNVLSRDEEIQIGEAGTQELVPQYGGAVPDEQLQRYVREVGESMLPYVEGDTGELPWEFTLLNSEVINAFALPGGKVFVTRGLASQLSDEAQLAGVLGHEIGHVTAEHADKRIASQLGISLGVTAVAVAAGLSDSQLIQQGVPLLVGVGGQGFLLKFGRDEEHEADSLGMRYMARAGYDPAAMAGVMDVLAASSGEGRQPEFLSTHPYPESRADRIRDIVRREYEGRDFTRSESAYRERMLRRLESIPPPPRPQE